ncbi:hypothetical protein [Chryseobacterium sp. JUb7]|uniref:hypothetical protein n=1 Tax=Chryseobacterium sp. JUb7 TaxID=2940599 RepID=UPI0021679AA1|nr:hypothetical protein [Chryseobacterium sp. JUb7]MCS3530389.1 hypothetical protein [Chryseobacterium sp. JUb7]
MNPRVLELLKNPKNIQSEDLNLLKEEIDSFPFIQNIRALHLYGIHLYDKANYQKELSITAAYTTDKKILYQLINGKIQQKQKPKVEIAVEEKIPEFPKNTFNYTYKRSNFPLKREDKETSAENIMIPVRQPESSINPEKEIIEESVTENKYAEASCLVQNNTPEIKHVYVDGERNRILFEGEENFLNEENSETIDLESTLESGSIVTHKQDLGQLQNSTEKVSEIPAEPEITEELNSEVPIESENISDEKIAESKENAAISEVEPFMEEVNIPANDIPEENTEESASIEGSEILQEEGVEFTPETIINEDKISSEKMEDEVKDESDISFHETQSFMPDVNIPSEKLEATEIASENKESAEGNSDVELNDVQKDQLKASEDTQNEEVAVAGSNKHEDEMRRLIERVEKKMKESKKVSDDQKTEETDAANNDISFAETQSFEVISADEKTAEDKQEVSDPTEEAQEVAEEPVETNQESETEKEIIKEWKPMSFEAHVPDSLINKEQNSPQSEAVSNETEISEKENTLPEQEDVQEIKEDQSSEPEINDEGSGKQEITMIEEQKDDEAPVMNVSFFSSDISSWSAEKSQPVSEPDAKEEMKEIPEKEVKTQSDIDSNVPGFINTWQSWLKIDREEEEEPVEEKKEIIEIKNKVIETFIENNPKISQLKEESAYVIKERNDDISHLMTETLATLYFEQKLYTKAIKAFEILIKKTPEKKAYFEEKIQNIKDFRSKN